MSVGRACWFLKPQGWVALLLSWASAPQQGVCRVALGQDVLRKGPRGGTARSRSLSTTEEQGGKEAQL